MDPLWEPLRVLGIAGAYLVGNLVVALFWCSGLSRAKPGAWLSFLFAPAVAAGPSYWLKGRPYDVLLYGVWAFSLGIIVVTVTPMHATKRGKFDRRYKHNPDVSGITAGERVVALAGFVGVVVVMIAAWVQGWPGHTLK